MCDAMLIYSLGDAETKGRLPSIPGWTGGGDVADQHAASVVADVDDPIDQSGWGRPAVQGNAETSLQRNSGR